MGDIGGDGHGDPLYTQYDLILFINISIENFLLNESKTVFNENSERLCLHGSFKGIKIFLIDST
jgi:hypothetical protein